MSYCRWSNINSQCDLYIISDIAGGWTTMVANIKYPEDAPKLPECRDAESFELGLKMLEDYSVKVNHPWAGETFRDYSLTALYERLVSCRISGLIFPDYVIERVSAEMQEGL